MRRLPVLVAFLALLAGGPPPTHAELASMVADLEVNAGPDASSYPYAFQRVGTRVVFFAQEPGGSVRPWSTDGTPAGTERLPVDDTPVQVVGLVGGAYLWFGWTDGGGYSLWRTGGTPATTRRLVAEWIYEPPYSSVLFTVSGDRLYFFRRAGQYSDLLTLWESDGTTAGTGLVSSVGRIGNVYVVTPHRGQVFFLTASVELQAGQPLYYDWKLWRTGGAAAGARLVRPLPDFQGDLYSTSRRLVFISGGRVWESDGTRDGTRPVAGPPGEPDFQVNRVGGTAGGRLYLGGRDPVHGDALWASDGTGPGTRLLARGLTLGDLYRHFSIFPLGGRFFFVASDGTHGAELWSTRGTAASTAMVADVCPGSCSGLAFAAHLAAAGERLVFPADDGRHGRELWATDGTAAGTALVRDHCPGSCGIGTTPRSAGADVFYYLHRTDPVSQGDFVPGVELWASDGSSAGTRRLTDFALVDTFGPPDRPLPDLSVARIGRRVVSVGWDPRGGVEPRAYDAAGRGGRPLGDLAGGGDTGSEPFDAVALGERLLFMTDRGGSAAAWSTGGSAETTVALGELPRPRLLSDPPLVAVIGDLAYLNLDDLWATDGTTAGTVRLTGFAVKWPGSRVVSTAVVGLGGRGVFGVTAGGSQVTELWSSDGTPGGTHRAGPTSSPLPSFPTRIRHLTAVGDQLYFWADDGLSGWEIWSADSTLTRLLRLTDRPHPQEPGPPGFTRIGAQVYFLVPDRGGGRSLWRSDGTAQGTERVSPPTMDGVEPWQQAFTGLQGSVLVFTSASNGLDLRLWAGDGSGSDWNEIGDFGPGSRLLEVVPEQDQVLFLAWQEGESAGPRLFRSDGTAAGTVAVLDFPALGVGSVQSVTPVGRRLFFAAGPIPHTPEPAQTEPWISDGTQNATRRLQEIAPGPAGSGPRGFTPAGSRLYFSADDGVHGRELWSLPLDPLGPPCRPSATALCLGGGRFRAELFRHDRTGARGDGRAVSWSSSSGAFWFYGHGNPEAVVKMVDGGAVNGSYWLFFGPLGDAHAALTVTDLASGASRRYPAEPGPLPAFAHLAAFPSGGTASSGEPEPSPEPAGLAGLPVSSATTPTLATGSAGPCRPTATRLCLHGGRFAVDLAWRDGSGTERPARGFAHGDGAGYFAFYGAQNVQAALKILDGRGINGRFWLFATSLTHLGYTLTVTDSATGTIYRYPKPAGELASVIDLASLR